VNLDQLLLQGSPDVANNLINVLQQSGNQTADLSKEARRNALKDMAEMSYNTQSLQKKLQEDVLGAETSLKSTLEERLKTGEGGYLAELKKAAESGLLTADQAKSLGIQDGQTYGKDLKSLTLDPQKYSTLESIAGLSDLAKAQALGKLGGRSEQNIFANQDIVGQQSAAEKVRLAELQEEMYKARKAYEAQEANQKEKISQAMGAGNFGDSNIEMYRRTNSEMVLNALNNLSDQRGGLQNLTQQDLNNVIKAQQGQGSGHSAWGLGDFERVLSEEQNLANLQNQNLQNRIAVEQSDKNLIQPTLQSNQEKLAARQQMLQLLTDSTSLPSNYYGAQFNTGDSYKLLDAFNRITGRNLKPIG
jgi:hypothetical protein